jgi:hypothetical protein
MPVNRRWALCTGVCARRVLRTLEDEQYLRCGVESVVFGVSHLRRVVARQSSSAVPMTVPVTRANVPMPSCIEL